MRSMSVVPPARNCAGLCVAEFARASAAALTAALVVLTASNVKGRMASLLARDHHGFGLLHRGDNVGIGAAAAQVSAHVFADGGCAFGVPFVHAANRRQDLPRRAIATLERVMIDEGLLHRMKLPVLLGEAFDCGDGTALGGRRQREARQHATSVNQHGASAALTVVAAFLCTGEA